MKPSSDTLKTSRPSSAGRAGVYLELVVATPYLLAGIGLWFRTLFPLYPIGVALLLPSGLVAVCALTLPGLRSGRHPLLATLALLNLVLGVICWVLLSQML